MTAPVPGTRKKLSIPWSIGVQIDTTQVMDMTLREIQAKADELANTEARKQAVAFGGRVTSDVHRSGSYEVGPAGVVTRYVFQVEVEIP